MQALRTLLSLQRSKTPKLSTFLKKDPTSKVPAYVLTRNLATINLGNEEASSFHEFFPTILNVLMEKCKKLELPQTQSWFESMLKYNVPEGKHFRGLMVVIGYNAFTEEVTDEGTHLAHIIGWCIEMLHSAGLMIDDILDNSYTRRGQVAWFRTHDLGNKAFLDGIVLKMIIYNIFVDSMGHKPYFRHFIKLYQDTEFMTLIGQFLDLANLDPQGKPRLNLFTEERLVQAAVYKTAYYTTFFPVGSALFVSNITDPNIHRQVKKVLIDFGVLYQAENDYKDCFEDSEKSGCVGTDIQDGKCAWPVVKALQKANPTQRKILEECYGHPDSDRVAAVKDLFYELELDKDYIQYARTSFSEIQSSIETLPSTLPHELFHNMINYMIKIK